MTRTAAALLLLLTQALAFIQQANPPPVRCKRSRACRGCLHAVLDGKREDSVSEGLGKGVQVRPDDNQKQLPLVSPCLLSLGTYSDGSAAVRAQHSIYLRAPLLSWRALNSYAHCPSDAPFLPSPQSRDERIRVMTRALEMRWRMGELQVGQEASKPCKACNATGTHLCHFCSGHGQIQAGGSAAMPCPVCKTRGVEPCHGCHGAGRIASWMMR